MTETNPPLLGRKELQRALGLNGFMGKCVSDLVFALLGLKKANRIFSEKARPEGPDFSDQIISDLGFTYEIPEEQLSRIPAEGGFITVSNHHYGGADGLILNAVIGRKRPDYKILTTYFLSLIPNLTKWFIPVDNFTSGKARSLNGLRAAFDHMANGGALGLFPAGEVATWQRGADRTAVGKRRVVEDKPWTDNMAKLIRKSALPVIPIYFDGGNSLTFHRLGRINPRLRTLRLLRELMGMSGKTVKVRIGQPISADQMAGMELHELGKYLRNRCYALEAQCHTQSDTEALVSDEIEPIAEPRDPEKIRAEIAACEDKRLFETGGYAVYLLEASDAPELINELYRLREVTFRAVGEGTGRAIDTDPFDLYYRHLILWHVEDGAIAGAYRLGYGSDIMAAHGGVSGFYPSTLVNFGPDAPAVLGRSMDLGRAFVTANYQREVLPLKLLLAGLCVAAACGPSVDYCVGLVSISNLLPDFYKSLAVHFLERDFRLTNAEAFATPTHPFKPEFFRVNPDELLRIPKCDIDAFDRLLYAVSDNKYRIPVLFRKYFNCGARLACFNVDPAFFNSLDAMIVLRLSDFPPKTIRSFVRSLPQETQDKVFEHFYGSVKADE